MTDRQVVLSNTEALVNQDLELSFKAVRADQAPGGVVPRFKKKEDITRMTKSILKHKIQTLTGKNIKQLEEAMGYKVNTKMLLLDRYIFILPHHCGQLKTDVKR